MNIMMLLLGVFFTAVSAQYLDKYTATTMLRRYTGETSKITLLGDVHSRKTEIALFDLISEGRLSPSSSEASHTSKLDLLSIQYIDIVPEGDTLELSPLDTDIAIVLAGTSSLSHSTLRAIESVLAQTPTLPILYYVIVDSDASLEGMESFHQITPPSQGMDYKALASEMIPTISEAWSAPLKERISGTQFGVALALSIILVVGGIKHSSKSSDDLEANIVSAKSLVPRWSLGVLMLVLLYAFLLDNTGWVSFRLREHDYSMFLLGVFLVFVGSCFQVRRVSEERGPAILSPFQTNEWKGAMQIGFLLYHYFRTGQDNYNLIRIFISGYVFLTGYGNTFSFYKKRDFSFAKISKSLWRINLFCILLCLAMKNSYMLYYFVPLITFNFLILYITLLPLKFIPSNSPNNQKALFGCVLLNFLVLVLLFEVPGVWDAVMYPFSSVLSINGTMAEWHFRSKLDCYSVTLGMLAASLLPTWTKCQKYIDSSSGYTTLAILYVFLSTVALLYTHFCYNLPKLEFNAQHPYTSWIPVVLYIVARNSTPFLRSRYLFPVAWVGMISLETYLLQFHIWLGDDAKSIVVFTESSPHINFLLASALFIAACKAVFEASNVFVSFLSPDKCSNNTAWMRGLGFTGLLVWSCTVGAIGCYAVFQ